MLDVLGPFTVGARFGLTSSQHLWSTSQWSYIYLATGPTSSYLINAWHDTLFKLRPMALKKLGSPDFSERLL
jgi:hypothetical protein